MKTKFQNYTNLEIPFVGEDFYLTLIQSAETVANTAEFLNKITEMAGKGRHRHPWQNTKVTESRGIEYVYFYLYYPLETTVAGNKDGLEVRFTSEGDVTTKRVPIRFEALDKVYEWRASRRLDSLTKEQKQFLNDLLREQVITSADNVRLAASIIEHTYALLPLKQCEIFGLFNWAGRVAEYLNKAKGLSLASYDDIYGAMK